MWAATVMGGALHWAEHPDPVPGSGQLLVGVRAAGINAADLLQRQGFYPAPLGVPPDIPGLELAGEVVAAGPGTSRFVPGDRVMALTGGGAQAELAVVEELQTMAMPDGIDWSEAGGFPEAFCTAHDALFSQAGLTMGERALVTGAAGGVGTAAVQLAVSAGAEVVASVRRAEHRQALVELGASRAEDPSKVGELGPFDVVLELVGGAGLADSLSALDTGGRVVVIGVGAGARVELDLLALMVRRARISGSTLRSRSPVDKAQVVQAVEKRVVPAFGARRVRVPVAERAPLSDAQSAYDRFAAGGKLGKLILVS